MLHMATLHPSERRPLPQMPPGYERNVLGIKPDPSTLPQKGAGGGSGGGGGGGYGDDNRALGSGSGSGSEPYDSSNVIYTAGTPCGICGRMFGFDRVARHEKACKQTPALKRGAGAIAKQYIEPMQVRLLL